MKRTPWQTDLEFHQIGRSLTQDAPTALRLITNPTIPLQFNDITMNPISINSTSTDTNARTLISTIASSLNAAQYALDVVEVWRQRSNRLPHSIESTAMLVTAIVGDSVRLLHDLLPQPCTSLPLRSAPRSALRSVSELRSTYSLAILRSVNGLVDANNQGGGTKRSVASLASNINLPAWLVDLRHDISHNEMTRA